MTEIRWTDEVYQRIVELLGARTGLTFRQDQRRATEEGIEYAMRRAGIAEAEEFAQLLNYDIDALEDLIVKLTVGETYFFREESHFQALRHKILPELRRSRGAEELIRIWSVGCASGEEPYTIAIVCDLMGLGNQSEILATDISSAAIEKAREGVYRSWSLRGEAAENARPYLKLIGDGAFQIQPRLRDKVRFEFLNLAMDVYPSAVTGTRSVDVIFCRNVLIYFSKATIKRVATRLSQCLSEEGWLITASSDPPLGLIAPLEPVVTDFGVFYRRPDSTSGEGKSSSRLANTSSSTQSPKRRESPLHTPPLSSDANPPQPPVDASREGDRVLRAGDEISPRSAKEFADAALERGDYASAVALTSDLIESDAEASVIYIKALGNINTMKAIARCEALTQTHPLVAELHHLLAVMLMEQNLDVEAIQAAQRAVYVDSSLAMAHFLLGSILRRRGSLEAALRSFKNALRLCESCPPHTVVPLTEEEFAMDFARMARQQVAEIERVIGRMR